MAVPSLQNWQSYTGQRIYSAARLLELADGSISMADRTMLERAALAMLEQAWRGLLQSLARQQGLHLDKVSLEELEAATGHPTAETGLLRSLLEAPDSWLAALLARFRFEALPELLSARRQEDDTSTSAIIPSMSDESDGWTIAVWSGRMRKLVNQIESSSLEC